MENKLEKYIVQKTKEEVPGVVTLSLTYEDGSTPSYFPGQYINVYFPESSTPEGKAYSISGSPKETAFTITVRGIGEFSNKLVAMKIGDTLDASLPYGFFRPESDETNLVLLASGIGVTPLRGIIKHEAESSFKRPITLFHSIRTSDDAIFNEEFRAFATKHKNFVLKQFVTREEKPNLSGAFKGRISISTILQDLTSENTEFLVCGSIPFTRDMWRALKENSVPEDFIYTEAFFSH